MGVREARMQSESQKDRKRKDGILLGEKEDLLAGDELLRLRERRFLEGTESK